MPGMAVSRGSQMRELVVGARGSALALRQTELVLETIRRALPELIVRIRPIRTAAERHPDRPLEQLTNPGFFMKELEVALLGGEIDVAVHSMKDLPTATPDELTVAAVTEREDPRDVLVARAGLTLETLPGGATVGTSSPRRSAYLRVQRPDLVIVPIRGTVETRLRKVETGEVDAVCLAGAGLRRLGLGDRITQWLSLDVSLPAPGQGALGVEVRANDMDARRIVSVADHRPTRAAVEAERALLRRLEGGCRAPIGALARVEGTRLVLTAMLAAVDGSQLIRGVRTGSVDEASAVGNGLAEELLTNGAGKLQWAMPREAGDP